MDDFWGRVALVGGLVIVVLLVGFGAFYYSERERRRPEVGLPQRLLRGGSEDVLALLRNIVIVVDAAGAVVRVSPSAYVLGLVRGNTLREEQLISMAKRVRRTGGICETEVTLARPNGELYLDVRAAPLGSQVLLLIDDQTPSRRLERVRRDFVSNISHELKTPVGAISLLAETVRDNSGDAEIVKKFSRRLMVESERLASLVHEIIALSRLQEPGWLKQPEAVSVDGIVAEAVSRVSVKAGDSGVKIVCAKPTGYEVYGNWGMLVTALRNLVHNAVIYTDPRPGAQVSVGVSAGKNMVSISVVDRGIGMEERVSERVFERFYRAEEARTRALGGSGLGLSIVKHIVADHGGRIKVWSRPGEGSTFTLMLPRVAKSLKQPANGAAAAKEAPGGENTDR